MQFVLRLLWRFVFVSLYCSRSLSCNVCDGHWGHLLIDFCYLHCSLGTILVKIYFFGLLIQDVPLYAMTSLVVSSSTNGCPLMKSHLKISSGARPLHCLRPIGNLHSLRCPCVSSAGSRQGRDRVSCHRVTTKNNRKQETELACTKYFDFVWNSISKVAS